MNIEKIVIINQMKNLNLMEFHIYLQDFKSNMQKNGNKLVSLKIYKYHKFKKVLIVSL
jgi:hypothetical protein